MPTAQELRDIAATFGSTGSIVRLSGGRGVAIRSGEIVLKPVGHEAEARELAELVSLIPSSAKLRIPRPIRSAGGDWVEQGRLKLA